MDLLLSSDIRRNAYTIPIFHPKHFFPFCFISLFSVALLFFPFLSFVLQNGKNLLCILSNYRSVRYNNEKEYANWLYICVCTHCAYLGFFSPVLTLKMVQRSIYFMSRVTDKWSWFWIQMKRIHLKNIMLSNNLILVH